MGDQSLEYTLDEALSALGFGTYQSLALVFAGISWFSESLEMSLLSFIGPAVKSEWSLSPTEESLLSTSVFAGMLIGAFFWGLASDTYGRRQGIRGVIGVIAIAGLLSGFSPDYKSLIVIRSLVGFGVAGGHVIATWFLEFVPSSNRGAWTLALTAFWILGELFVASLAWIVMPRLGWRWLLCLASLPTSMAAIISIFIPESPRYLYTEYRTNEVVDILKKVASINRKKLPAGFLASNQRIPEEQNSPSEETGLLSSTRKKISSWQKIAKSMVQLFSPDFLRMTLLLLLLNVGYTFALYGVVLMISAVSSNQTACSSSLSVKPKNAEDTSLYSNVLITSSAEIPGLVISIILVERIGRKRTMEILFFLAFVLILPLCFHQNEAVTTAILFGARMLLFGASSSLGIYSKEVYPTSVRTTATGLVTSVGRIGGMICPLVAVGLVRGCHETLAAVLFGIVILVCGLCVVFLPLETRGRALT